MDLTTPPLPKRILIILAPRYYSVCLQIMTLLNMYRYLFKVQLIFFVDAGAANIGVVDPETREKVFGYYIIKFIIDTLINGQLSGYEFHGEIKICHYSTSMSMASLPMQTSMLPTPQLMESPIQIFLILCKSATLNDLPEAINFLQSCNIIFRQGV